MPPSASRRAATSHPLLYEVNIRVLLNELSRQAGEPLTLETLPDSILDEWAGLGCDIIWLMGVWSVGKQGVRIAREYEGLRAEYRKVLPDVTDDDVIGSPYAVSAYAVSRPLGGARSLQVLRKKLEQRGMGLMLDFVSNHTARDHRWVSQHPEYFVQRRDGKEAGKPSDYFLARTVRGERTLAFGRDPYFPGWTDTAQLNPLHPGARKAMIDTLLQIGKRCDGIRCDMAMLLLGDVFRKTWGEEAQPVDAEALDTEFWVEAVETVRKAYPGFLFLGEAYWNLEWPLQQAGFDYTYDKTLYDRLLHEGAGSVRDHLKAEIAYQLRSARFVENHDEKRIATALPSGAWQYAAATIAATVPGMFLMHEGQLDGRKVKIPVQLGRRPDEEVSVLTRTFYRRLLACLGADVIRSGEWKLLNVRPAWHDNYAFENVLAFSWQKSNDYRLVVVNYAPQSSQCYIDLNLEGLEGITFDFRDLMSTAVYSRERATIQNRGMYFDLPGYGLHIFEVLPTRF